MSALPKQALLSVGRGPVRPRPAAHTAARRKCGKKPLGGYSSEHFSGQAGMCHKPPMPARYRIFSITTNMMVVCGPRRA